MRRLGASALLLVAIAAGTLVSTGASSPQAKSYEVRAIFDDAAFAVTGEDVRIAGAPVGSIAGLEVTAGKQAAVTLKIHAPGFVPFHQDAYCAIRPQSLIGDRYVDCTPGTSATPALSHIKSGPGSGTYYLPVSRTSSPVDSDVVQDIYRQPVREQFALILNELGTGLAARGSDLQEVIRRADPALGRTDQVLKILARQNRQLAQLATDSDTVLTPLARDRKQIADFVLQANRTAVASATRANDIARSFQLLPTFLRRLRPLMADLGQLADQGTPLMASLVQAAPGLARQYQNLAPFARAARTSLIDLGASSAKSQGPLLATIPLDRRLLRLGNATVPTANLLDRLTSSLDRTGAIEQLMAVLFYGTTSANGFDSVGHYLRTEALVGCNGYTKTPDSCAATFAGSGAAAAADATAAAHAPKATARLVAAATRAADPKRPAAPLSGLLRYLIGAGR